MQLPTSADNVTLLAFAVERRAAAAAAAVDRYHLHTRPTASTCWCGGQQTRQTDGRTPYRYIDSDAYYASNVNKSVVSVLVPYYFLNIVRGQL